MATQFPLIVEECDEFIEAYGEAISHIHNVDCREALLKELSDLVYVCFQFAAAAGWDLNTALDRVHESNLSKLVDGKPVKNPQGKVTKGPNYHPPILIDLV